MFLAAEVKRYFDAQGTFRGEKHSSSAARSQKLTLAKLSCSFGKQSFWRKLTVRKQSHSIFQSADKTLEVCFLTVDILHCMNHSNEFTKQSKYSKRRMHIFWIQKLPSILPNTRLIVCVNRYKPIKDIWHTRHHIHRISVNIGYTSTVHKVWLIFQSPITWGEAHTQLAATYLHM